MKERLFIIGAILFFLVIMIGLNALSYVQRVKEPDSEFMPIRSTYHPGATGLQAYYSLLEETERPVLRWQRPPSEILSERKHAPKTFIIVGPLRREYSDNDRDQLLEWVGLGGTLVIIDREPPKQFLSDVGYWTATVSPLIVPELLTTDPADRRQMTVDTPAVRPSVPALISASVNAVQPSRFASAIEVRRATDAGVRFAAQEVQQAPDTKSDTTYDGHDGFPGTDGHEEYQEYPADEDAQDDGPYDFFSGGPTPGGTPHERITGEAPGETPPPPATESVEEDEDAVPFRAPIVHLSAGNRNLLVEFPYGGGRILVLGDPYIVSNGGISTADNAQLAINLAAAGGWPVAFDEYHHGYGVGGNRIFEYFHGTPVVAILTQLFALTALVLVSRSRRFARPIPVPEPGRLTKLEYVGAMAELQLRTKAFDLALENIYGDFRRRVSRSLGVDNTTTKRWELALMIAERTGGDAAKIDALMADCEDIVHGGTTDRSSVIRLASELREMEESLRLTRHSRRRI